MYNRVGISVGDMYAIHVGNSIRTEFLVAGEPLHQLAPTIEAAQIKTVVLSVNKEKERKKARERERKRKKERKRKRKRKRKREREREKEREIILSVIRSI